MSVKKNPAAMTETSPLATPGMKSMTGFAAANTTEHGWSLRLTIRSVNHRFLDLHVRLPEGFESIEPAMRKTIRERVRRGHLDVTLYYEPGGKAAVGINQEVAAAYMDALNGLKKKFRLKGETDLTGILRLPGVIGTAAVATENELARLEASVARCLAEALDRLDRMREAEANHLREEMSGRLGHIAVLARDVEVLAERARPQFAERLRLRLVELLGESAIEPARLAQEAAMAAERSDVSEELTRLESHVQQFEQLLGGAPDVGKKLDFLLQEMQREANTLLSKTPGNDGDGLEITRQGIEIKSEIEKLREQVQNIE
ncbi:MAG TPA: YicC/YloC family endoribonuclease [Candidatus Acidoferrum sp.]|nr:YicC/YloC family endoribonuclease [Candidatus Acidoferrum sp.]